MLQLQESYKHLRLHERICQFCNMGSIEDEYHFLMICLLFLDYRDNLFNSITCFVINFNEMSNNDEFQYINKNHQKGLAKFLTF